MGDTWRDSNGKCPKVTTLRSALNTSGIDVACNRAVPPSCSQALELPLDRGVMEVGSASAGEAAQAGADATIVLRRHPDFRLFATQNPGAGG